MGGESRFIAIPDYPPHRIAFGLTPLAHRLAFPSGSQTLKGGVITDWRGGSVGTGRDLSLRSRPAVIPAKAGIHFDFSPGRVPRPRCWPVSGCGNPENSPFVFVFDSDPPRPARGVRLTAPFDTPPSAATQGEERGVGGFQGTHKGLFHQSRKGGWGGTPLTRVSSTIPARKGFADLDQKPVRVLQHEHAHAPGGVAGRENGFRAFFHEDIIGAVHVLGR